MPMLFTRKKVVRAFYMVGSSEIDMVKNTEGRYTIPSEVFLNHLMVYIEKSNGEIQPVQPEEIAQINADELN